MFEEGLYAYLAANASLKAVLGNSRSDKTSGIFPGIAGDQCPVPYIVLMQVGGQPLQESFAGTGALQANRWRFSCFGDSYKSAKNLANVLKQTIINMNGPLPGGAGMGSVQGAWLRLEADENEPIPHGTLFSTHVDFEFNYLDV